jgi:hypothetical protein
MRDDLEVKMSCREMRRFRHGCSEWMEKQEGGALRGSLRTSE